MLLPSRRASVGSTCYSGEVIAITPASSEVDERPNLGMLASPLLTPKREASAAHSGFITLTKKILHVPTSTGDPWRCTHTRESQVEIQMFSRSLIQRKRESLLSIEKSAIALNYEQIMPPKENRQLYQNSLKREYHTRLLLKQQKNHILSEARSELHLQELRVESADRALRESGLQLNSQRMELYQTNQ